MTKDQMTERNSKSEKRIERLARELPRSLSPETDLWPRIAARIDTPAERRIRQLPRDIEAARDLWPGIRAGLTTRGQHNAASAQSASPRSGIAAGVGFLAVAATALLLSIHGRNLIEADSVTASAIDSGAPAAVAGLPGWMAEMLAGYAGAAAGTPAASLGETALLIQRDFLMVRSERLRIEQALTESANDTNLRAQWRNVYMAELGLIDEAQKLGNIYSTRSEI